MGLQGNTLLSKPEKLVMVLHGTVTEVAELKNPGAHPTVTEDWNFTNPLF
jgi:hypothetical protein